MWGIGRRSAPKLKLIGIKTAFDFTQLSESAVRGLMGINGVRTWQELHGIPCIAFEDGFESRQSICVSRSFSGEIYDVMELSEQIANFASSVAEKLRKQQSSLTEMTVFAYTNRFKEDAQQLYATQLVAFPTPTADSRTIVAQAVAATRELFRPGFGFKKAGVIATRIIPNSRVVRSLFDDAESIQRDNRLSAALDTVNGTFGQGTVKLAVQGCGCVKSTCQQQSPHYTTLWSDLPKVSVK